MTKDVLQVVAVLIIQNNSVLLVRHVNSKHIENIYGLPGGKKEINETEIMGAKRELEEETGLVASLSDLFRLPTLWRDSVPFKDESIRLCSMRVFRCKHYSGIIRATEKEIPEWIPLTNVGKLNLLPNVQEAIQEGLRF